MNKALFFCTILFSIHSSAQTVSVESELRSFYAISSLPAYRANTTEAQVSSYDTTGGNDDGFSGKYSFLKRNADSSLVIFDEDGPGVINRIWTATPTKDTLDIYIDDLSHPVISICYKDLFSGKVFPFVRPLCANAAGGYYCYFPLPYQKHGRIVCRGKRLEFHQIGYRSLTKGTKVESYRGVNEQVKQLLTSIAKLYSGSPQDPSSFTSRGSVTTTVDVALQPGATKNIFQAKSGGRIEGIRLSADHAPDSSLFLRVVWDNETKPAVYCPLNEFFGYAFGKPSMHSLLIGADQKTFYCYIPMPFDKGATVSLEYKQGGGSTPLHLSGAIYSTSTKRDAAKEGKFYVRYNKNELFPHDPMHTYLHIDGKGHYVGTILQAQGFTPGSTPFFEGDDSCATDGVMRMHGTGSEDSFNGGWYDLKGRWDTTRSLPLSGCLLYSKKDSRTGGYRFFLNDKIPFAKSIFMGIEHGPQAPAEHVLYTSVAFYYSDEGH